MRLCEKYKIHLICNKLYALSVWDNTVDAEPAPVPFVSCLSIDPTDVIDTSRLHVIWGISKELGANGLRLGAIASQNNPNIHAALVSVAIYSSSSSAADQIASNILEDTTWINNYITENQRLLSENYSFVTNWAKEHDLPYAPGANGAFFLWVNFGRVYQKRYPDVSLEEAEKTVDKLFLNNKVFVAAGSHFAAEEPGWFRMAFASSKPWLEEGLARFIHALEEKT